MSRILICGALCSIPVSTGAVCQTCSCYTFPLPVGPSLCVRPPHPVRLPGLASSRFSPRAAPVALEGQKAGRIGSGRASPAASAQCRRPAPRWWGCGRPRRAGGGARLPCACPPPLLFLLLLLREPLPLCAGRLRAALGPGGSFACSGSALSLECGKRGWRLAGVGGKSLCLLRLPTEGWGGRAAAGSEEGFAGPAQAGV